MVIAKETRQSVVESAKWSFSADGKPLSIEDFLETYRKQGVFYEGKEQWLKGVTKVTWENFFLVCTEELDDISQRAAKMLILYCLESRGRCRLAKSGSAVRGKNHRRDEAGI